MADDNKKQVTMINLQPAPFAVLVGVNCQPCPSPVCKSKKKEMLPVVEMVCVWALVNAFFAAGFSILTMILNRIPCTKSVPFFRCVALTPAAAAEVSTLVQGQLWCSAPQAAAAAALLLPPVTGKRWRRIRWALAVAALAATAANHYMKQRSVSSFRAAAPGDAYLIADVVFGFLNLAVDLLCFLCLLLLGDGQE